MDFSFPEEYKQAHIEAITKDVLGGDRISLNIDNLIFKDLSPIDASSVEFRVKFSSEVLQLSATGVGIVDALCNAFIDHFKQRFFCLETIQFDDFALKVSLKESQKLLKADATAEIMLVLKTNKNKRLYFRFKSRSLVECAVEVVREAMEFLINCEQTVVTLHHIIENLEKAKRRHMIDEHVFKMAEVVQIMNFEKTINELRCKTSKKK